MCAVSLSIAGNPDNVTVKEGDKGELIMSCKYAGSNIPKESPWKRGSQPIQNIPGKYVVTRNPPDETEGVVTWKLHFLNVSKTSSLFGDYCCNLSNITSRIASLTLAGK